MNNFITFYVLLRMPYYLLISYWSSSKYLPLKVIKNVYSLMTDTLSHFYEWVEVRDMVLNNTFNYISVISWRSVLSAEETGVTEKTTDLSQVTDKLYSQTLYQVHFTMSGFKLTTVVVKCTDCTGRCKSNYPTITTTEIPFEYIHRQSHQENF